MTAATEIVESLLDSFEEKKITDNDKTDNTSCGDIIYPSKDLLNKLLHYNLSEDDTKESKELKVLKSTDSDISIKLRFINESDKKLSVYWINYEGDIRVPPSFIQPNNELKISSFITHPFMISISDTLKNFSDIIAVYIPKNISYSQHDVIINKTATKLTTKAGKINDKLENKIWTLQSYEKTVIHGFTIYFEIGLIDKYAALIHILNNDLKHINNIIPKSALKILKSTPIWLNDSYLYYNYEKTSKEGKKYKIDIYKPPESMCFHPTADWLIEHGNLSNKAECIEIYRVKDWIKERGYMPLVLLHELAHAYHWYLGFDRVDVLNAYNSVKQSKNNLYRNIPFILGGLRDAYALTNQMEYFSELTESYFGLNDFYPFNKDELREYDNIGYKMMETVWNFDDKQIFIQHQKALKDRREKEDRIDTEEKQEKQEKQEKRGHDELLLDTSRIVSV